MVDASSESIPVSSACRFGIQQRCRGKVEFPEARDLYIQKFHWRMKLQETKEGEEGEKEKFGILPPNFPGFLQEKQTAPPTPVSNRLESSGHVLPLQLVS